MRGKSWTGKRYLSNLLLGAGLVIVSLFVLIVEAEEHQQWLTAQASVVAVMSLFWLTGWIWWRETHKPVPLPIEAATYDRAIRRLLLCVSIGFTGVLLNANRWDHWNYGLVAKSVGYGTLVAGASFISGVLLGFIFGFRPAGVAQISTSQSSGVRQPPHTNLEEIADWLTKIILGAGLVELTSMREPIWQLSQFMAKGVEPAPTQQVTDPGSPAIALAIMGFFFASGVLYGYLWTRYEASVTADSSSTDVLALTLVDRWLNNPSDANDETRADMIETIERASIRTQVRIFLQAEHYRKPSTEQTNTRSAPIFQALVEADLQEVFHRNRGQYAFALMGKAKDPDNSNNDWSCALNLLSKAILIRDGSGEKGWPEYELARAVCKIHIDPNFKKGQPSSAEEKQSILSDLDKANQVPEAVLQELDQAGVIASWRSLNPQT